MTIKKGDIVGWDDLCAIEGVSRRGMHYHASLDYSVVLMSDAHYCDTPYGEDDETIEYEGHDAPNDKKKIMDQPLRTDHGNNLSENGKFVTAVLAYRRTGKPEKVKVFAKITTDTWVCKGFYDLIDYKKIYDGRRHVFHFFLKRGNSGAK